MTKKFWNNWQKRVGETDVISLFYRNGDGNPRRGYEYHIDGKIQSVKFNSDGVTIVTEIWFPSWNPITGSHRVVENRTHSINRKDIRTVFFRK